VVVVVAVAWGRDRSSNSMTGSKRDSCGSPRNVLIMHCLWFAGLIVVCYSLGSADQGYRSILLSIEFIRMLHLLLMH